MGFFAYLWVLLTKDNDMTTFETIGKMTVRSAMLVVLAVVAIAISSCSDDDDWWGDEATKEVFEKGISVSESGGEVNVAFAGDGCVWTPSVVYGDTTGGSWIEVKKLITDYGLACFSIKIADSQDIDLRRAKIEFVSGKKRHIVPVEQAAKPQVVVAKQLYLVPSAGGTVDVVFDTNGEYACNILSIAGSWLKETSASQNGHRVRVSFAADANNSFGREAKIMVSCRRTGDAKIVVLRQEPRQFAPVETMHVATSGQLATMLGSDESNWRRINHLTLDGTLNFEDVETLKNMFKRYDGYSSPLTVINMAKVQTHEIGYRVPTCMFSGATSLTAVTLPLDARTIGTCAFQHCTSLRSITIPNDVRTIEGQAFAMCDSLEEIKISPLSQLTKIGAYAFNTGTAVDDLLLPGGVTALDYTSLFGLKIKRLHVRATTPPVVTPERKGKTTTVLCVPKGCVEAYRNAAYWKDFAEIIEDTEDDSE